MKLRWRRRMGSFLTLQICNERGEIMERQIPKTFKPRWAYSSDRTQKKHNIKCLHGIYIHVGFHKQSLWCWEKKGSQKQEGDTGSPVHPSEHPSENAGFGGATSHLHAHLPAVKPTANSSTDAFSWQKFKVPVFSFVFYLWLAKNQD